MRTRKLIGIAAAVLGLAVVAAAPILPPVLAAGGQDMKPAPNVVVRRGATPLIEMLGDGGPRLGVQIRDIEKDELARLRLTSLNGVAVVEVTKDSAAERAGVRANDVIVQFDGENVRSTQQLTRLVRETVPGRVVKMALMRDGKRVDVDVTPAAAPDPLDALINRDDVGGDVERQMQALRDQLRQYRNERRLPAPAPPAPQPPGSAQRYRQWALPPGAEDTLRWFGDEFPGTLERFMSPGRARLGVGVQNLTPDLAAYFGVSAGVLVSNVDADRPAAKAGMKAADVITAIDGKAVTSPAELIEQLAGKHGEVTISVTRDKKALTLKPTLDAPGTRRPRVIIAGRPVRGVSAYPSPPAPLN
jgi:membrane-associated protease RseP (regulator of RpoE activity)